MKYYLHDGRLYDTQAQLKEAAPKADAKAAIHNIPTDSEGLREYVQALMDEIAALKQSAPETVAPVEAPPTPAPSPGASRVNEQDARQRLMQQLRALAVEEIAEKIRGAGAPSLAKYLTVGVERLGELGEEGFDALQDEYDLTGVGAAFSRGVHILSIFATGEHQMMRIFGGRRKNSRWGQKDTASG